MKKGRIIFLNGVTSSGKTSIAKAVQQRADEFYYALSNDMFQSAVGLKYLQEDYWKHICDAIIMLYHTAKLFSDMGKNVLIDGMLLEKEEIVPHYQRMSEIFKDNPFVLVEVYCPLDICKQRNIARGDRYETQSEEQAALMAKNIDYELTVDTSIRTPEECADVIIKALNG